MLTPTVVTLAGLALISASVFYLFFYRDWQRQRALRHPFPEGWRRLLREQVPLYRRLSREQQHRLEQHVQLFLEEKTFYGCDGFTVDDRVRLTIAGHACLLILNRSQSLYDEVRSVLVYPDVYQVKTEYEEDDQMVVTESEEIRAGEASGHGQVVLAWPECEQAATDPHCPHNVMLHEFAHQLDYLDGSADGAPPLPADQARHWQQVMTRAWGQLQHDLDRGIEPWLDPYGGTEPAEFFAVLTEAFFQTPADLKHRQPEVYQALADYYGLDTAGTL